MAIVASTKIQTKQFCERTGKENRNSLEIVVTYFLGFDAISNELPNSW